MHESNASISWSGGDKTPHGKFAPIKLRFHAYNYFPYERALARREVERVAGVSTLAGNGEAILLPSRIEPTRLRSLTYIAEIVTPHARLATTQHEIEESHRRVSGSGNRQATRYSVHGLHEYKGRFNPQIVRFLLNYLGANKRTKVLDPFCGSGTTLVESSIHKTTSLGLDSNPLAVFLSNSKLRGLATPTREIDAALRVVLRSARTQQRRTSAAVDDARLVYLSAWFPREVLQSIEVLRASIREHGGRVECVLLSIASDLLRDYSLQEPSDLRIRRRSSAFPSEPFLTAFEMKADRFLRSLGAAQEVIGLVDIPSEAVLDDSRRLCDAMNRKAVSSHFDLVITSPPYATALPYIDTQRLSLVWLGLCSPDEIRRLEAEAVGSREIHARTSNWQQRLLDNVDRLPKPLIALCRALHRALTPSDGFRRQAVPSLIYRYFADMRNVFIGLQHVLKDGASLAFVVGANHTTLGGKRFDIGTANALSVVAEDIGFRVQEVIPLQTYHRYGLHQRNATLSENLTILRK